MTVQPAPGGAERVEVRRPGRPRSRQAEAAILDATLEVLAEHGLEGLTIESVARRAGVGKATIYRRWPSRMQVVVAAFRTVADDIQIPNGDSVRDDLVVLLRDFQRTSLRSVPARLVPRLIAVTMANPELLHLFLANVYAPRRAALLTVLERGVRRGELRADADLNLMVLAIVGPIFHVALLGDVDNLADPQLSARLVDLVLQGCAKASTASSPESLP